MKIVKNTWQAFILWTTILWALYGAMRDIHFNRDISFSVAGLLGNILMGVFYGSIFYGIWYAVIGRRKKILQVSSQASKSKWGIVKENLKIVGFILLIMFIGGVVLTIVISLLARSK